MLKKTATLMILCFMALMSAGCPCPATKLNVTIELDDAMKTKLNELSGRNIQVDIVAINSKEHQRWENYSMTKYWAPHDELRNSVKVYPMVFDPSKATTQTLSSTDPIWNQWLANTSSKDVMRLYVVALLPGTFDDAPGDTDQRRQILPLGNCCWANRDVKLQVQKSGIITITAPKPDKVCKTHAD